MVGKSDTDVKMLFCVVETVDGKLRVVNSSCRFTLSGVSVQRKDMRPTADGVTASYGVSPSGRSPRLTTQLPDRRQGHFPSSPINLLDAALHRLSLVQPTSSPRLQRLPPTRRDTP